MKRTTAITLCLALASTAGHGATVITNTATGQVTYVNKTAGGYSATDGLSGKTTQFLVSPQGLTAIPQEGESKTYSIQDATGEPEILLDQTGEE